MKKLRKAQTVYESAFSWAIIFFPFQMPARTSRSFFRKLLAVPVVLWRSCVLCISNLLCLVDWNVRNIFGMFDCPFIYFLLTDTRERESMDFFYAKKPLSIVFFIFVPLIFVRLRKIEVTDGRRRLWRTPCAYCRDVLVWRSTGAAAPSPAGGSDSCSRLSCCSVCRRDGWVISVTAEPRWSGLMYTGEEKGGAISFVLKFFVGIFFSGRIVLCVWNLL